MSLNNGGGSAYSSDSGSRTNTPTPSTSSGGGLSLADALLARQSAMSSRREPDDW